MGKKTEFVIYKGVKYTLQQGYYRVTIQLHREVWQDHFGEIPKDHHIHHKNGDTRDNRIENLECIHRLDHLSLHNDEKRTRYRVCKLGSRASIRKKRVWYLLKQQKSVSAENSKIFWQSRQKGTKICIICGATYSTRSVKKKSGCCSNACRCYLYRMRKAGLWHDIISTIKR